MQVPQNSLRDAAQPSSSRNLSRLSLIFQRVSSPKPKSDNPRRPTTAPGKKSHKRGLNTGSTSVLSDTNHSYATTSSSSVTDTLLLDLYSSRSHTSTHSAFPSQFPPSSYKSQSTNNIADPQAMNLLKKARKLTRMFGESPGSMTTDRQTIPDIFVSDQSISPTDTQISPSTLASSLGIPYLSGAKTVLRSSVTVGHVVGEHAVSSADIHRSKSHGSLRPSLAVSSTTASSNDSPPISPISFAPRNSGDFGQNRAASADDAASEANGNSQDDHGMPLPNSRPSEKVNEGTGIVPLPGNRISIPSAFAIPIEYTGVVQSSRQSDKYYSTRAIGPTASSSTTPVPLSLPSSSGQLRVPSEPIPRRSASMRSTASEKANKPKKRLSLDVLALKNATGSSLGSPSISPRLNPSPRPSQKGLDKRSLKKTRSMWIRRARTDNQDVQRPSVDASLPSFSPVRESFDTSASAGPLTEKQRLLNVRRAKKMTQLFGDQPPMALFQITQLDDSPETTLSTGEMDSPESNEFQRRRESLATIISISSSISTNLSNSHNMHLRDSYLSISSVVTTSSRSAEGIVATGSVVVRPEGDTSISQSLEQPVKLSDPITPKQQDTQPDNQTLSPPNLLKGKRTLSLRPSTAPTTPTSTKIQYSLPSPRTPPPFSDLIVSRSSEDLSSSQAGDARTSFDIESNLTPAEFRVRQRRAAKLSQFFGVGMNDLVDVLPANTPSIPKRETVDSVKIHSRNPSTTLTVPSSPMQASSSDCSDSHPTVTRRVEVAAARSSRLRFLGHGEDVKQLDMTDAIDKLRRMKST